MEQCPCGCGLPLVGRRKAATDACRVRQPAVWSLALNCELSLQLIFHRGAYLRGGVGPSFEGGLFDRGLCFRDIFHVVLPLGFCGDGDIFMGVIDDAFVFVVGVAVRTAVDFVIGE